VVYAVKMNLKNLLDLSDDIFKTLTEQSTLGISVSDLKGNYLFANNALSIMTGYTKPELLSMNNSNLLETELIQVEHEVINQCTNDTGKQKNAQFLIRRNDNSLFTALIISKTINLGGASCILATIQDISEEVIKNNETKKKEHFNNIIREVSNDGIWDWNLTESIIDFDERYYTMAGYQRGDLSNRISEWYKKIHRNDVANVISQFKAYMAGEIKNYDVEFRFKCKNNNYIWIRQRGKIIEVDENNKPLRFVGTHSDINMQKEYENEIILQAHFDSLTFLPNRFLSLDRLTVACEDAKRKKTLVALLFLDLDDFKKINDTLGHEAGDTVLIEASERLRSAVRSIDTVGRLGGDEFIVILGGLKTVNEIHPIIENLLKKFRAKFSIRSRELKLTTSIGVAFYPNDAEDTSTLLRHADSAMYDAKAKGRNTFSFYTDEMNTIAQRRLCIEEQLHDALTRNEFFVVYQPKIDFSTLNIMGAEALLRWSNPTLGQVSPDEFIPIAEQTGFIVKLGEFVLKEALKQAKIWQETSKNFQIAVNLSPRQFRDPKLFSLIKNTIDHCKIPPHLVELEITEGVLLKGQDYIKDILTYITDLNIKLVMDDFGTGYSSLNYLRTYSFDVVKIDKSFINEINDSAKDKALIHAMLSMSHALGIKVVAEGIETKEQWESLKQLGCDYGQGYLFSKPIDVKAMTTLLKSKKNICPD